jgi:2-(1,2-epoxy-1,2-dihydrophenyl)acetyl-CoA isomerase
MGNKNVLLEKADGVATITMNRPERLNALDVEMGEELLQAFRGCGADPEVRVIVLTGAGRTFSAGGDVKAFAGSIDEPVPYFKELIPRLHAGILEIRRMPKPVIARVHGFAAGAAMSLTMACDLVVAAESARFNIAYARVGLSPDGGSTYFLPRLVGQRKALEIFFTADIIEAAEAARLGLVNWVVPDGELEKTTRDLALRLARGPALALGRTKELVNGSLGESLESQLDNEEETILRTVVSEDFGEGVRAFVEKREPGFKGR